MPYITEQLVAALEPKDKDYFIWDSNIKGFGVKVTPLGRKTFVFQWKNAGKNGGTKRRKIGLHSEISVKAARHLARNAKDQASASFSIAEHVSDLTTSNYERRQGKASADNTVDPLIIEDPEKVEDALVKYFSEHAGTRNRIMAAASKILIEKGFDTSIDLIAIEANLSRYTVYNYFSNKEELVKAVINEVSKSIFEINIPKLDLNHDPYESLLFYAKEFRKIAQSERFRQVYILAMNARNDDHLAIIRYAADLAQKRILRNLELYISSQMKRKVFKKKNAIWLAEQFISAVEGNERPRIMFGLPVKSQEEANGYLECLVENFVAGLLV